MDAGWMCYAGGRVNCMGFECGSKGREEMDWS